MVTIDIATADELVQQHLPVVGYLVNEVTARLPGHVDRDDLVSAGLLALVQAGRAFDAAAGVPFGAYARTRIRGAILDELRAADWAPRGVRARARAVSRAEEALRLRLGRAPEAGELAALLGTSPSAVDTARADIARTVHSLDAFDGVLEDRLPDSGATPEDRLLHAERIAVLHAAVESLPDRLRTVVTGVFLQDRSMGDIAAELGVTESRVSQLRTEALALLRDGINSHLEPALVPARERPDGVVARRRDAYYAQVAARAAYGLVTRPRPAPDRQVIRSTA
jgi:RNA polymerase sigma factor FliA